MLDINDLFPNGLSIEDALDLLEPVAIYVIGMAIYAVFVFNFLSICGISVTCSGSMCTGLMSRAIAPCGVFCMLWHTS